MSHKPVIWGASLQSAAATAVLPAASLASTACVLARRLVGFLDSISRFTCSVAGFGCAATRLARFAAAGRCTAAAAAGSGQSAIEAAASSFFCCAMHASAQACATGQVHKACATHPTCAAPRFGGMAWTAPMSGQDHRLQFGCHADFSDLRAAARATRKLGPVMHIPPRLC
jgi:hypothetical protein